MNILDRISKARWAFCEKYYAPPTKLYLHPELLDELYLAVEPWMSYTTPMVTFGHEATYMDMKIVEVYDRDYLEVG